MLYSVFSKRKTSLFKISRLSSLALKQIFGEKGRPDCLEKNLLDQSTRNQQTQATNDIESGHQTEAYQEVVTQSIGNLGQCVSVQRSNNHEICPASQLLKIKIIA